MATKRAKAKKTTAKRGTRSAAKRSSKKKPVKKARPKKTTAKKSAAKKPAAKKGTGKKVAKNVAKKGKPAAKKPAVKKSAAAKTAAPRKTATKAPARKSGTKRRLSAIRVTLLTKKASLTRYLQSELTGLESTDKHHLADLEEMASDTQDTDSVCEIMEVGASTLDQIEQALVKLDDGTYGRCEECDGDIPFERLEALPFATLCISCKRKQELARPF